MTTNALITRCTALIALWVVVSLISSAGSALNTFAVEFLFRTRALLTNPSIDPRIKIFSFDDRTVASLNAFDISLEDWSAVLTAIDARKPRIIMIDKIFDNPAFSPSATARFAGTLSALTAPVVPIVFGTNQAIPFRETLNYPASASMAAAPDAHSQLAERQFIYGPNPDLASHFRKLGHALYEPTGYVPAAIRSDAFLIPHWSFSARDDLRIDTDDIFLGSQKVPLTRDGKILVDINVNQTYASRTYSMATLVEKARDGKPISIVKPDDIVVILPAMYTGNTDWRETPLGAMQGGFIMTAMLQSVLSANFLKVIEWTWLLVLVAGLIPLLLLRTSLRRVLFAGIIFGVLCAGVAVILFVFSGIVILWVYPTLALISGIVAVFYHRSALISRQKLRMQQELETAQLVQNSFFSPAKSQLLDMRHFQKPASECGGDWWGHFRAPTGHEYLFVSDATGHGAPAALVTAMTFAAFSGIQRLIEQNPESTWRPEEICQYLNQVFCGTKGGVTSMTCFVARFDPDGTSMSYCNGGHVRPFLIRPAGATQKVSIINTVGSGGNPVGLFKDSNFKGGAIDLIKGDRLVFLSDGIYENFEGFNLRNFRKMLQNHSTKSAGELLDAVTAEYTKAGQGRFQEDDVTLLVIECLR